MDTQLDPLVGRESELERVIHILCRRTKNNPVLIGEAGVVRLPSSKDWRNASPMRSSVVPGR